MDGRAWKVDWATRKDFSFFDLKVCFLFLLCCVRCVCVWSGLKLSRPPTNTRPLKLPPKKTN